MLTNLYIKNFALFNELSIDFDEGLNIISGETGSGKSILINAISLLLAGRINKNFIGNFSDETIVEASFSVNENIKNKLKSYEINADDNLIITRRFTKSSSSIKLNNRPINLSILEDLSQSIMDIHGQHSQLVILNKSNYLKIIDSFDDKTSSLKEALKRNMTSLKELKVKLDDIDLDEDEVFREIDILKFQVDEIEAFDFDTYDEEALNKEHKKLSNLTEILSSIKFIQSIMSDGYQRNSLKDEINEIYSKLLDVNEFDDSLKEFTSRLIDIKELINELSRDIDSYYYSIDLDEERLAEIDDIFSKLQVLKRKYGPEIKDIQNFLSHSKERLLELKNIEEIRGQIYLEMDKLNKNNIKLSKELREIREKIINQLERDMINELSQMNMNNLSFKILLEDKEEIDETGKDQIDFLISTNKGQDMKSLNKVVSGGEISRFMLALKAVLADSEEVQTIVFDEIDTGISGFTADVVGDKLVNISKKRQLIVITHLPQIASKADNHYMIEKKTDENFTTSSIKKLTSEDRIKEIARLISGANITDSSLKSARELIKNAKRWQMDNSRVIEEHTIKSEKIYEGKIIKVRVDTVELPDQAYAKREIVEHARGVSVVAVDKDQNIYLVRQYRKPIEKIIYEIPAGLVEAGEDISKAASRELQEEIGLKPLNLELIAEAYVSPGFTDEKLSIFFADEFEESKLSLDDTEFLTSEKMPLKHALEMVENFEITDAKSIIGILYAARKYNLW